MKKTVYLSLGSNVGDRQANLAQAISHLAKIGTLKKRSAFYETEPMEITDQPWFLNCTVELETELMPKQFIAAVLDIEREMGRKRTIAKGPRVIDIDVLLFGSAVIETPQLTVPHPAMQERRFVLEPLAEIAPEAVDPVTGRTIRELLADRPSL